MVVLALLLAGFVLLVLGLLGAGAGAAWVGVFWLAAAAVGRLQGQRLEQVDASTIRIATVLRTALVFLSAGLPALLVGLFRWGVEDDPLRWFLIGAGAFLTAFAVVPAALFLLGSGIEPAAGDSPIVPASIVIVSAAETGTFVNERPRIEFVLDVTPDGQPSYRVTKKATVPLTALGSIRPGDGFCALVAGPEDPTRMEIDWTASLPRE